MKQVDLSQLPFLRFSGILRDVKKNLPKTCSFLGPIKTQDGEFQIKAIIKKEEYRFTTPAGLNFTNSDIKKLETLLLEKC